MPTPHLQDGAAAGQDHYFAACGLGQGISLMIETYNIDTELNQVT
jgi:galactitol-specific phosphotransferase system IIB component